ncbi:hypothetical protein M3664_04985 [Paenibacillus lautus]|uniref:hypothetical protein n=1 Tax=Paenibacillus lautus TaxID=1401 RepID=UPI00203A9FC9|nr:hypothetical protein [Paenibacillus lautus]MCM3257138.1 hypothetical protein [Paenibacillus lautus]
MSNFDRFQTPYLAIRFPDPQENEDRKYSDCSGCTESITETDLALGVVLDIYGMVVHDNIDCIKKAVQAKTLY